VAIRLVERPALFGEPARGAVVAGQIVVAGSLLYHKNRFNVAV